MLDNIENLARDYITIKFSNKYNDSYENGLIGNPFYCKKIEYGFGHGLIDGGYYGFLKSCYTVEKIDNLIRTRINTNRKNMLCKKVCKFMLTLHDKSYYHEFIIKSLKKMDNRGDENIKYLIFLNKMLYYYV